MFLGNFVPIYIHNIFCTVLSINRRRQSDSFDTVDQDGTDTPDSDGTDTVNAIAGILLIQGCGSDSTKAIRNAAVTPTFYLSVIGREMFNSEVTHY